MVRYGPRGFEGIAALLKVSVWLVFVVMLTLSGYAAEPKNPSSEALRQWEAGFELYRSHRYSQAIRCFEAALSADPTYFRAWNGKGVCLAFMGRPRDGLALIDKALTLNPQYENGHFNRALALELSGRWGEAIGSFNKALEIVPSNAWSWYGKACSYGMLGKAGEAAEALHRAIELDPSTRQSAKTEADLSRVRKDPRIVKLLSGSR